MRYSILIKTEMVEINKYLNLKIQKKLTKGKK